MSTRRHVQTILRERTNWYIRPPMPFLAEEKLQIIGGQTSNGIHVITYVADDPTLTTLYDPDVDTTYPDGLGHAWLIDRDGNHVRRVLVRHDFGGDTDYAMGSSPNGGWVYTVRGVRSITVASGPDAGKAMSFYLLGWAV